MRKVAGILLILFVTIFCVITAMAEELSAPENLTVSIINYTTLHLEWDAVEGATSYAIESRAGGITWWPEGETETTGMDIANPQFHHFFYRVIAKNQNYESDPSKPVFAALPDKTEISLINSDVRADTGDTDGTLLVLWTENPHYITADVVETYYTLYRKNPDGSIQEVARINEKEYSNQHLTDSGKRWFFYNVKDYMESGHTYQYGIAYEVKWIGENIGETNDVINIPVKEYKEYQYKKVLEMPGNVTATPCTREDFAEFLAKGYVSYIGTYDLGSYNDGMMKISWKPVEGATVYYLYQVIKSLIIRFNLVAEYSPEQTMDCFVLTDYEDEQQWLFALCGWDERELGPEEAELQFAKHAHFTWLYVKPCENMSAKSKKNGVALTWNSKTKYQEDAEYVIFRKDIQRNKTVKIAVTDRCSYVDQEAEKGKEYAYYVVTEVKQRSLWDYRIETHRSNPSNEAKVFIEDDQPTTIVVGEGKYEISDKKAVFVGTTNRNNQSITIEDSITLGDKTYKVTGIRSNACKKLEKLTEVTIGKYVTGIEKNAFRDCKQLQTVKGATAVKTIGDSAFAGCVKLTSVPNFTKLVNIENNAFRECKSLMKVILNSKLKQIGKNAFLSCEKLKIIIIKTKLLTAKTIGVNAFKNISKKACVTCPKGMTKSIEMLLREKGMPKDAVFK